MIIYFGGDSEVSFGILYIPSIFIYSVFGAVLVIGLIAMKELKKRLSNKSLKSDAKKSAAPLSLALEVK